MAAGGTRFVDEIGDLSPALQAKLLRVLHKQRFERVGGTETLTTDARIIAATWSSTRRGSASTSTSTYPTPTRRPCASARRILAR